MNQIQSMIKRLKKPTVCYSNYANETLEDKSVFIVDTIGLLSKIYSYADIAYIGGGMGASGLHNTLEAATFGLPIVIGKNYKKFPEAKAMLSKGGLFSIHTFESLESTLNMLINDAQKRIESGQKNKDYIEDNKGASELVMSELKTLFK